MKQKFNVITSTCIPLPLENIDTDQIIPARFLKAIDKDGMGENLFRDWRYRADGTPNPDFVIQWCDTCSWKEFRFGIIA